MNLTLKLQHDYSRCRSLVIATLIAACELSAVAQQTNEPAKLANFSFFQIISDRNIFNPNRYARNSNIPIRPRTRVGRRNTFSLVGTMSYDQGETPGIYAFFDGTSSDYRQVLKPDGMIAGFKVAAITPDTVVLLLGTTQTVMQVGMQMMRDEGQGRWVLVTNLTSYARNSADESGRDYSNRRRGFGGRDGSLTSPGEATPRDNADTNLLDNADQNMATDQGDTPPDDTGAPSEPTATGTVTLPSGPASDALLRLMQLRQQEEQQSGGNTN